jgi:glycine dehydrogenase
MLGHLGMASLDELVERVVPASIRSRDPLDLPPPLSEAGALARLGELAAQNRISTSLIGLGYYATVTPPVILRNLLENPGWYTAYTPYQAEVSQGRLEALLNFQQMVIDLTGMELANASLLDEATAAAEAMTMARRVSRSRGEAFFVDALCHPQTIAVVATRARHLGIRLLVGDPLRELGKAEGLFGALFQYPATDGSIRDLRPAIAAVQAQGALAALATDLLALTLLTPPGELGADIALGSAQRFGVPIGYGGPHAAFFATREAHKRALPGRIIGVSVDARGEPALRMALQTREQHIRREKATSNICTAQVLLANIAGMYVVWHGAEGITRIARRTHALTALLAHGLRAAGLQLANESFFDTLTLEVPGRAHDILLQAREVGIELRLVDHDHIGLSLDETSGAGLVQRLLALLTGRAVDLTQLDEPAHDAIPEALRRRSRFLTHPVFSLYRSETELMRYLRRLQAKDVALDRSMIPLGSCTMKLNAAAEMIPITWPSFGAIHPFVPADQARGYQALFRDLEGWLKAITGFDAVSLQPNAGSQGEYAGLLVIRAWHEQRGDGHRDICLIPASAHGTNPASAIMAGMRVVVVGCDQSGNVDLADLRAKAGEHADNLAALMVTYPSTHGVFEEKIRAICATVHEHGGQVYMDGANLNALVGLARPAEFGADVCHINLHKTFCIPHGGGGPGMGPIACKTHLAPFLPNHPLVPGVNPYGEDTSIGPVSAAPWGSASILPISWAYIAMMGGEGLTRATKVAILNANYIAKRLGPHYPVVYTGEHGLVAHECIVDIRGIKERTGITAEDIAKRLVDFGFHAPTMSWPVPETMMIEPTESEAQAELDRFCSAMIAIREEIRAVERGESDRQDNPLKRAPHTADLLFADWTRPYSREQAFFPAPWVRSDKYWPPVARVDNAYGDRHLVCACPPLEDYREAAE